MLFETEVNKAKYYVCSIISRVFGKHCRNIVLGIPGPINLKSSHDNSDPLTKAAFAGSVKIEALLSKSETTSLEAKLSSGSEKVGLLTMTRTDKTSKGRSSLNRLLSISHKAHRSI